jgi:hypothetical protein
LINSTIAKAAIEIFISCFLSTFGDNDRHMTKLSNLSLKIIFCNEISPAKPADLYSKQATIYKRDGAKLDRHFQQQR